MKKTVRTTKTTTHEAYLTGVDIRDILDITREDLIYITWITEDTQEETD